MTLAEAIVRLDSFGENRVICARAPWIPTSDCVVPELTEQLGVPQNVLREGYKYFLEVLVAKEALEVFGDRTPTDDERVRLVIHYAEKDAFPDWVYE